MRFFRNICLVLAGMALLGSTAIAQDPPQVPTPGEEHAMLKEMAGDWVVTIRMPDGSESKGTSTNKMECGGLWLVCDFHADFGGIAFQGRGLDGYDAKKKKFVSVWVDSMTASPLNFEGTYDAKEKKMTMTAKGEDEAGKPATWTSETVTVSKDRHTFRLSVTTDGGEKREMMVAEYNRKKE